MVNCQFTLARSINNGFWEQPHTIYVYIKLRLVVGSKLLYFPLLSNNNGITQLSSLCKHRGWVLAGTKDYKTEI